MGKSHFILGKELCGSHCEELLHIVMSYIINILELLCSSGTCLLQYQSRPRRDTLCQSKGKFGKFGRKKSCSVIYGSTLSSGHKAHGPSTTTSI